MFNIDNGVYQILASFEYYSSIRNNVAKNYSFISTVQHFNNWTDTEYKRNMLLWIGHYTILIYINGYLSRSK